MKYNWENITSLAYLTLLELNLYEFPISIKKIKLDGVKIISYQEYARKTNLKIEEITLGYELNDAFLIDGLRPDLKLILYNEDIFTPRLKHSLLHEIGHLKCDHNKHSKREEIEAHFFASQVNAPNIIIKAIANRGYSINVKFLMNCFGLSKKSAEIKMGYLKKYSFEHSNEYDDLILLQFSSFLDLYYPSDSISKYDEYFDKLETERQNWI